MSGPIPAGYETDEEELEDEFYYGPREKQQPSFYKSFTQASTSNGGGDSNNVTNNEEPIYWQSAIQSSMDDSKKSNSLNNTTLHSASSKLQDSTLLADTTPNGASKNSKAGAKEYNPFDEYKTADGYLDLDNLNDKDLPDENDDNESLPPNHAAQNLKIYGDLELFLCYIKEDDLIELFDKHEVTFRQLLTCNEHDLINIGIDKVGIRKKILEAVSQVHARKWEPTSLTDLTAQDLYTSPGVFLVLSDIKKHLQYIRDTIYHLKSKIESDDEILELGKDFVGIRKIMQESMELVEANKDLHIEATNFVNYIKTRKLNSPLLAPANQIDQKYIRRISSMTIVSPACWTLLATTLLVSFVVFKVTRT